MVQILAPFYQGPKCGPYQVYIGAPLHLFVCLVYFCKMLSIICLLSLLCLANAHFFINVPSPFPESAVKEPLDPSGSNFPCHGADLFSPKVRTPMKAGQRQPLGFDLGNGANTAVHGGGSCQISITYETDPLKTQDPANWKVIKSFIGGCPTDAKGNLATAVMCDGDNSPECVNSLSFDIPLEVKNGDAVLAWTWFNNVGEREMYMNCAAVSFTDGQNQLTSLPSLFVANLAHINQCKTTEDFNTAFPNPGKYIQREDPPNYPVMMPAGVGCQDEPVVSSNLPLENTTTLPQTNSQPETLVTAVLTHSQTLSAASSGSSGSLPGTRCQNGRIECSAPGFFCIGTSMYGICTSGCALPMPVSEGTDCMDNAISFA